ncbi:MAG: RNA methyltransferase [Candidatus Caenarcaniphilales bacterium]|nr:RNA methyltransferase [Candidatus Caenarcaniphilales bacterium]
MAWHIYGRYPIQEFLKLHPDQAVCLWYLDQTDLVALSLPKTCSQRKAESHSALARQFRLKEFESHQGLILEIKRPIHDYVQESVEELIQHSSASRKHLIWLPSIQDGHNLGAVSRNCLAFEQIYGLILPAKSGPKLIPAVAKVSAGSLFHLHFGYSTNHARTLQTLKLSNIYLIALQNKSEAIKLNRFEFPLDSTIVFILGDEEKGVPREILKATDHCLAIPQSDRIDSLNLSVASGILLYELFNSIKS